MYHVYYKKVRYMFSIGLFISKLLGKLIIHQSYRT